MSAETLAPKHVRDQDQYSPDQPWRSLVVVQAGATQFDGPFYRFLQANHRFQLTVYYTEAVTALRPYDRELGRHPDWDNDATCGYSLRVYPRDFLKRIWMSVSLVRSRPDLIILSGWHSLANLAVLIAALLSRVPVGVRSDNCFVGYRDPAKKRRLKSFLFRRFLRLFSTAHPVGSLAAEYFAANGFDRQKMFLFPYLVDPGRLTGLYREALPKRQALRLTYGIGENDFVVLGVMKFVSREDPLTLVTAFISMSSYATALDAVRPLRDIDDEPLSPAIPPRGRAHLLLVGDGEQRPDIERCLSENTTAHVHMPGYVAYSRLPEFFALADVLVHPARQESWGMTVSEALACGLPVIAADSVGSAHDLVSSGVNGFTFPAGDAASLARLLEQLSSDPALLATLKAQCGTHPAMSRFSYSATEQVLHDALEFVSGAAPATRADASHA